MRWPWVSRELYDLVKEDRDWFRARFREQEEPKPPKKPVVMPGHAVSDEQIVSQAERNFIQRLRDDLVKQGVHPRDAEQEARRIRQETATTTMHPRG